MRYLPHIILGLSISLIMVGAYMTVGLASTSVPKATWAVNPLTITFSSTAGMGSASDSFTCSPSITNIQLVGKSSNPTMITLTVAPTSFASCGSTPDTVTITVSCDVPAAQCAGTYQGLVQIRNPTNYYGNIPDNLKITIIVT
ncbi:MAG TPA: hypothetical protein VE955_04495 [Candidatus Dormibacteraeota bacterium]|nr:hypothetical protein [Candidatus Dormibacteraeota bacterium]